MFKLRKKEKDESASFADLEGIEGLENLEDLEDLEELIKAPETGPEELEGGLEGGPAFEGLESDALKAPDLETQFTEMGVKLANMEKKVDRVEAFVSTTRSEAEDLRKKIEEHEDNIQKLLSVYEVVSEKFNPFIEREETVLGELPEELELKEGFEEAGDDISRLETMYALMAKTSISVLVALIEDMKRIGIDTSKVERCLPEEMGP